MATIPITRQPRNYTIEKFYGLNQAKYGDTQLILGESGDLQNVYITKDYDISKMYGYKQLMATVGATKSIQGMWYGKIGTTDYFLVAADGHIYQLDNGWWDNFVSTDTWASATTDLGTLTDAPTQFLGFGNKVYIINGSEYKYWAGTGSIADVTGYVPKTHIGCLPATGAGTAYESLNLLTGSRHKTFHGDGTSTVYKLVDTNITSVDAVYVSGTPKTLTTHYTVSTANGTVTFTAGNVPATGLDNVDIYYTKSADASRTEVFSNKFITKFGTASDNRVFLYGNANYKNKILFSPLANGVPSAEYFTAVDYIEAGESNSYVTSLEATQSHLFIHKPTETYSAYYDAVDIDGVTVVNFPTTLINSTRGNVPMGQGQILANYPFTIDNQILKWLPEYSTQKDERNAVNMSERIQVDLDTLDLSDTLTIDKQNSSEMFISNGDKLWIYRYDLGYTREGSKGRYKTEYGTFSRCVLAHTPTCWLYIDGSLYFGTTTGLIMKFDEAYVDFNGTAINSYWEMNMFDFGYSWIKKTLNKSWLTTAAQPNMSANIQYITENNAYSIPYAISYSFSTFDDVDFSDYTFYTNYNPQVFYLRIKAKKFKYLKLRIDNSSLTTTFSILNLTLKVDYGNEVK